MGVLLKRPLLRWRPIEFLDEGGRANVDNEVSNSGWSWRQTFFLETRTTKRYQSNSRRAHLLTRSERKGFERVSDVTQATPPITFATNRSCSQRKSRRGPAFASRRRRGMNSPFIYENVSFLMRYWVVPRRPANHCSACHGIRRSVDDKSEVAMSEALHAVAAVLDTLSCPFTGESNECGVELIFCFMKGEYSLRIA